MSAPKAKGDRLKAVVVPDSGEMDETYHKRIERLTRRGYRQIRTETLSGGLLKLVFGKPTRYGPPRGPLCG